MTDGTIEVAGEVITFRYERHISHSIDAVWQAITDDTQSEAWFGGRIEIELRPGGSYVSYHQGGMRVADRVLRVEAPRLLTHTFWVEMNPGALVTWELRPDGDGCMLTLTHTLSLDDLRPVAATSGQNVAFILARNAAGWHHLLDKLAAALDGRSIAWMPEDGEALRDRYAAMVPADVLSKSESSRAS